MKRCMVIFCMLVSASFIFAADGAPDAGWYGNVTQSPFSGDIFGTTISLKCDNGVWSGMYHYSIDGSTEQKMYGCVYDSASKILRFHVKDTDGKEQNSAVKKTKDGILFKLNEKKDEQWEYLRLGNKSGRDYTTAYITGVGAALKKGASDDTKPADVIAQIPAGEKVQLPEFSDATYQNGYVLCTWKGKKGFVDQQFLWTVNNQVVTGNGVRMRDKPSASGTVLAALAEGTAVAVILPLEGEWVTVMCGGKRGYIHYTFVSK